MSREQEAVKLVVMRSALSKVFSSHADRTQEQNEISRGVEAVIRELPEPPAPGDPLSALRYTGFDTTKAIVDRVKGNLPQEEMSRGRTGRHRIRASSTPNNSAIWSGDLHPSAPSSASIIVSPQNHEPPPPYNNVNLIRYHVGLCIV